MQKYNAQTRDFELIIEMNKLFKTDIEIWRQIFGYDNYSVSTFGCVRNDSTKKILKNRTNRYGYYFVSLSTNGKVKNFTVHKLVASAFLTNPQNKTCVDHIDRNKQNNHITNLRFATLSENQHNKSKHKNNTTGYIGVCWDKKAGKYKAYYSLNGKKKHIGLYDTALEASNAYQAKIKVVFGEFANIN